MEKPVVKCLDSLHNEISVGDDVFAFVVKHKSFYKGKIKRLNESKVTITVPSSMRESFTICVPYSNVIKDNTQLLLDRVVTLKMTADWAQLQLLVYEERYGRLNADNDGKAL